MKRYTIADHPNQVLLDAAAMLRKAARACTEAAAIIGHGPISAKEGRSRLRAAQHNVTAALARIASYDTQEPTGGAQ